jgi:alkylated DNA repair protein alkB homolog 7
MESSKTFFLLKVANIELLLRKKLARMHKNFKLIKSFITPQESQMLAGLINEKFAKTCYQMDHYDNVIKNYRESTFSQLDPSYGSVHNNDNYSKAQAIISRIRSEIKSTTKTTQLFQIPHILDLHKNSQIDAHIDHIKASGSVIATLSLLSPTIIIFKSKLERFKCLIPPNSLYIQWDELRYDYSHEIPKIGTDDDFDGERVERGRRISIIQRTYL